MEDRCQIIYRTLLSDLSHLNKDVEARDWKNAILMTRNILGYLTSINSIENHKDPFEEATTVSKHKLSIPELAIN